jgi:hypothetical protein
MKFIFALIATCLLQASVLIAPAQAAERLMAPAVPAANEIGVGVMVGTIISATGKYWLSNQGAIDFGVGFSDHSTTVLYADYLWHIPRVFGTGTRFGRETQLYFGGGAGVGFWNHDNRCGRWGCDDRTSDTTGLFIRGLVGFEWFPSTTRFGVFAEVGPSILLTPHTDGAVDIGIGGRYYF